VKIQLKLLKFSYHKMHRFHIFHRGLLAAVTIVTWTPKDLLNGCHKLHK